MCCKVFVFALLVTASPAYAIMGAFGGGVRPTLGGHLVNESIEVHISGALMDSHAQSALVPIVQSQVKNLIIEEDVSHVLDPMNIVVRVYALKRSPEHSLDLYAHLFLQSRTMQTANVPISLHVWRWSPGSYQAGALQIENQNWKQDEAAERIRRLLLPYPRIIPGINECAQEY